MAAPSLHFRRSTQYSSMLEKLRSRWSPLRSTADKHASISGNALRSAEAKRSSRDNSSSSFNFATETELSTKICRHIFVDNSAERIVSPTFVKSIHPYG